MSDKVCGYTNFETFTVGVIIDNDSNYAIAQAQEASCADVDGKALREWVEMEYLTDRQKEEGYADRGDMLGQLLTAALNNVNWRELRDGYAAEAEEDEDSEDGEEACRTCGEPNTDGDGYDGECGNCADKRTAEEENSAVEE